MDPSRYVASTYGRPAQNPGDRWAFWFYHPHTIPRDYSIDTDTALLLSEADAAVGQLQGLGSLVKDPELVIGPSLVREAVASTRIEGTQASIADVLMADDTQVSDDVAEVRAYLSAVRMAFDLLHTLPIAGRLILKVHSELLADVRGSERLPGEYRSSPVWVGAAGDGPETARFVPPLPALLPDLLSDWERYVNEPQPVPVLIQAAVMHYQFETIHPFLDGNGRMGRLLVPVLLRSQDRLQHPLLHISAYFEQNRLEYYDRLQAVRESGDMNGWVLFFLRAVIAQARDGAGRARRLVELRESYLARTFRERSHLPALVESLFATPYITVRRVSTNLDLSDAGARRLIRQAEELGFVSSLGAVGSARRETWVAHDIMKAIEGPVA